MREYISTEAERRYRKEYYRKNRERILARKKIYDAEHKEEIAAYNKQYAMTYDRSEYFREYAKKENLWKS